MVSMLVHPENVSSPIVSTVEGIEMDDNLEQDEKALGPKYVMPTGKVTDSNLLQFSKIAH
jgi:hypothetical protein